MPIYIAQNKKMLTHYFIRIVKTENALSLEDDYEDLPELFNALTTAKSHKQIVQAVENACLLLGTAGPKNQIKRLMKPSEFLRVLQKEFSPVDPFLLACEFYMTPPHTKRANNSKSSPAAVYDAFACDLETALLACDDAVHSVLVEPIQDWMCCRNALATCASLLAHRLTPVNRVTALERAGFFSHDEAEFGFPAMVLPFKFNAALLASIHTESPTCSIEANCNDVDYLFWQCLKDERVENHLDGTSIVVLRDDTQVSFAMHRGVAEHALSAADLFSYSLPDEERLIYLCVRMDGTNQLAMARRIVKVLWKKAQTLSSENGANLGVDFNIDSLFLPDDLSPLLSFTTLNSKLWHALGYHEGRALVPCKHCGCGFLSGTRGPKGHYCSSSCRVQDSGRR